MPIINHKNSAWLAFKQGFFLKLRDEKVETDIMVHYVYKRR